MRAKRILKIMEVLDKAYRAALFLVLISIFAFAEPRDHPPSWQEWLQALPFLAVTACMFVLIDGITNKVAQYKDGLYREAREYDYHAFCLKQGITPHS